MREVTRARPTPPQRAVPFQSGISDKACVRHAQLHFAPTGSASLCPQVLRSPGPRLTVPTSTSPLRAGLVFQSLPAHVLTSSFFSYIFPIPNFYRSTRHFFSLEIAGVRVR